jgi:SCY1-like protein 1
VPTSTAASKPLQIDPEPSIRANTTVLLGNIAGLLGPAACKRILLNAFTRALRDVFPPSRVAALKALMATAAYHAPADVAARVVPAISPLMLDAAPDVRAAAGKARTL